MQNKKTDRAKIFMSFDSLKGFKEYLKQKERIVVERKELSEEDYKALDEVIKKVYPGSMIKVIYYDKDSYIEKKGLVAKLNLITEKIQIVEKIIDLKDIIEIEIL